MKYIYIKYIFYIKNSLYVYTNICTNKLDLAKLPSTTTNAYNLKYSHFPFTTTWVWSLPCRTRLLHSLDMGESQLLTRLLLPDTILTAISVTITQKSLLPQREPRVPGAGPASMSAPCQRARLFAPLSQGLQAQNKRLQVLVLEGW